MSDNLAVHPRAEIDDFAILRCAKGANAEPFEYRTPDQGKRWPRTSDHGGTHIAFHGEDMDVAPDHVRAHGVEVLSEGKKAGIGPEEGEGSTFAHFLTPWGQLLEFVSYPNGRAYSATTDTPAWRPEPS